MDQTHDNQGISGKLPELDDPVVQIANTPRLRLQMDLEFMDCLADPMYLPTLTISTPPLRPLLVQDEFLNYLEYLQYLRHPDYIKFVKFPHSLHILQQLCSLEYRQSLLDGRGMDPYYLQMASQQLQNTVMFQHTHESTQALAAAKEQRKTLVLEARQREISKLIHQQTSSEQLSSVVESVCDEPQELGPLLEKKRLEGLQKEERRLQLQQQQRQIEQLSLFKQQPLPLEGQSNRNHHQ
jgi:mediator of RNA polymerase II transcription subunit 31